MCNRKCYLFGFFSIIFDLQFRDQWRIYILDNSHRYTVVVTILPQIHMLDKGISVCEYQTVTLFKVTHFADSFSLIPLIKNGGTWTDTIISICLNVG